jgi:chemotaxis protein methyltransferase CheR
MMAMMEAGVYQSLKAQGWDIQILATDYASHVLERARNGVYSEYESSRGLSSELREKYFEKVETGWRIRESIRGGVDFKVINLLEPFSFEPFDVVFLRNVLIYFDLEDKKTVLDSVARVTSDQGYLFLGAAETALGYSNSWGRVDGARTAVFSRLAKVLSKVA